MISRRALIGAGLGTATLAACPALATADPPRLLVVDPTLLSGAPPLGAIAARGPALLRALLPRMDGWRHIDALLGEADAQMLHELIRFDRGPRWTATPLPAGVRTEAGRLLRPARKVIATRA